MRLAGFSSRFVRPCKLSGVTLDGHGGGMRSPVPPPVASPTAFLIIVLAACPNAGKVRAPKRQNLRFAHGLRNTVSEYQCNHA